MAVFCVLYTSARRLSSGFSEKIYKVLHHRDVVVAVLLITAPSNYIGGIIAILELFYGSVVTPIYEETIFRGYMWERTSRAFESEKAAFIITTALFTLWHIGYMLPNLIKGDIFAVATKLAAALIYGLIIGFVRLKSKNLYLPILLHSAMNLFYDLRIRNERFDFQNSPKRRHDLDFTLYKRACGV